MVELTPEELKRCDAFNAGVKQGRLIETLNRLQSQLEAEACSQFIYNSSTSPRFELKKAD